MGHSQSEKGGSSNMFKDKWGKQLYDDVSGNRESISNLNKVLVKDTGLYGVPNRLRESARPQTATTGVMKHRNLRQKGAKLSSR